MTRASPPLAYSLSRPLLRLLAPLLATCALLLMFPTSEAVVVINTLPPCLLVPPAPLDPHAPLLIGTVPPADAAGGRRAVLGYVSDKDWAILEFVAMMHSSWRHLSSSSGSSDSASGNGDGDLSGDSRPKLDLWAFAHPR